MSKVKSVKSVGIAQVFNMTVDVFHNFMVQGNVIVKNGDACRYFCISRVLKNVEEEAAQLQDELDEEEEYETYMTGGEISNAYIFA